MWSKLLSSVFLLLAASACTTPEVVGLLPRGDTYIDELRPDRNFDASNRLVVGDERSWEPSSARILLDFDLSSLPADPRQIRSATLLAFQEEAFPPGGYQACDVHRCTTEWNADLVTWSTGVGHDERIWATAIAEESKLQDWVAWDVTGLVHAELEGLVPRAGWMIKAANEGRTTARRSHFRNGIYETSKDKPIRLRVELWPLLWKVERLAETGPLPTSLHGLEPGAEVRLYASRQGPGKTYLDELDAPLALEEPLFLGAGSADAEGEVRIDVVAPRGSAGSEVWLQAVSGELRSNVTRLVVERYP